MIVFQTPSKSHFAVFSLNKTWVYFIIYLIIYILGYLAKDIDWATIKDFDSVSDVEEDEKSVLFIDFIVNRLHQVIQNQSLNQNQ